MFRSIDFSTYLKTKYLIEKDLSLEIQKYNKLIYKDGEVVDQEGKTIFKVGDYYYEIPDYAEYKSIEQLIHKLKQVDRLNSSEDTDKEKVLDAISNDLRARIFVKEKEKYQKDSFSKEDTELVGIVDEVQDSPKIIGIERGFPMPDFEAGSGNVNPFYIPKVKKGKHLPFRYNCQSCVVCYEMRKRGYDVQTKGNYAVDSDICQELSYDALDAYRIEGHKPPLLPPYQSDNPTVEGQMEHLKKVMKVGERYAFNIYWNRPPVREGNMYYYEGHVVISYLDKEDGEPVIYDPQADEIIKGTKLKRFIKKMNLTPKFVEQNFILPGIEIARIDNTEFNPKYFKDKNNSIVIPPTDILEEPKK